MLFYVHAYVDDQLLEAPAKTAKAAFARAIGALALDPGMAPWAPRAVDKVMDLAGQPAA